MLTLTRRMGNGSLPDRSLPIRAFQTNCLSVNRNAFRNPAGEANKFSAVPQWCRQQYCNVASKEEPTNPSVCTGGPMNGLEDFPTSEAWERWEPSMAIGNCRSSRWMCSLRISSSISTPDKDFISFFRNCSKAASRFLELFSLKQSLYKWIAASLGRCISTQSAAAFLRDLCFSNKSMYCIAATGRSFSRGYKIESWRLFCRKSSTAATTSPSPSFRASSNKAALSFNFLKLLKSYGMPRKMDRTTSLAVSTDST